MSTLSKKKIAAKMSLHSLNVVFQKKSEEYNGCPPVYTIKNQLTRCTYKKLMSQLVDEILPRNEESAIFA